MVHDDLKRLRRLYGDFIRDDALYNERSYTLLRTDVNLLYDEIKEAFRRIIVSCKGPEGVDRLRVLEIGAAWGQRLRMFVEFGFLPENLFGVDLLPHFVKVARRLSPSSSSFLVADSQQLPFTNDSFDIVFQCMVFSSLLDRSIRKRIGREMVRVTSPSGKIVWIDDGDPSYIRKHSGEIFYQGVSFEEVAAEIFPDAKITRYPRIILKKNKLKKCLTESSSPYSPYHKLKYAFHSLFRGNRRHEVLVIKPRKDNA